MKRIFNLKVLLAGIVALAILSHIDAGPAKAASESRSLLQQLSQEVSGIAEETQPAVVQVVTRTLPKEEVVEDPRFRQLEQMFPGFEDLFGPRYRRIQRQPMMGLGSGFVIDEDGIIMTNSHVVEGMDEITVVFPDGEEFGAEVVGSDPETEVAVIRIVEGDKDFPTLELGDSDEMRVGDFVLAIGSPQGLAQTVTFGIVSALNRDELGITSFGNFIQTDAAINRGNSGGPLLNTKGEVVGISTAIISTSGGSQGLGLAIPVNQARDIADKLLDTGVVRRGFMGVMMRELDEEWSEHLETGDAKGAVVERVIADSPAEEVLKPLDALIAVNGEEVRGMKDLRNRIAGIEPGETVRLGIIREGDEMTVKIELAQRPGQEELASGQGRMPRETEEDAEEEKLDLGFTVAEVPKEHLERLGFVGDRGLVVMDVEQSSEAYRKGLRARMLVTEVNQKKVETIDELRRELKKGRKLSTVMLKISDGEEERYLILKRDD